MRAGKAILALSIGLISSMLVPVLAETSASTAMLPPAIAMLKNLKNASSDRPDVGSLKSKKVSAASTTTKKVKTKNQLSIASKKKAQLMAKKPDQVTKPHKTNGKHKKLAVATKQQVSKKMMVAANTHAVGPEIESAPTIDPDAVQFDEYDLEKKQQELEVQIVQAKEREAAEAKAVADYYKEHEREIKLQQIAQALANHGHARKQKIEKSQPLPTQEIIKAEKPVESNLIPVKSKQIAIKQKAKKGRIVVAKPTKKIAKLKKTTPTQLKLANKINYAAKKEPRMPKRAAAKPSQEGGKQDALPDYAYLPEGAEIVAGNPYNDEFFIVGKDSPKKLKQLAEAAKHVDYVPPVVIAASNKESSKSAVKALIQDVATKVTHTAKYVTDPFVHYLASKRLAAKKKPAKSGVTVSPLAKPKFASEKIATRIFSAQLDEAKKKGNLEQLVSKLDEKNKGKAATLENTHPAKPMAAASKTKEKRQAKPKPVKSVKKKRVVKPALNASKHKQARITKPKPAKHVVAVKKAKKQHIASTKKKVARKLASKRKAVKQSSVPKKRTVASKAFKPVVKSYADMIKREAPKPAVTRKAKPTKPKVSYRKKKSVKPVAMHQKIKRVKPVAISKKKKLKRLQVVNRKPIKPLKAKKQVVSKKRKPKAHFVVKSYSDVLKEAPMATRVKISEYTDHI